MSRLNPSQFTQRGAIDAAAGATDPNFANVVALVGNNNAADGTTTITDQAGAAHTFTAVGNAAFSNLQAPTGMTTSIKFDGTGDYLSSVTSADWKFGTGDYTIEAYCYITGVGGGGYGMISQCANAASWASGWTADLVSSSGLKNECYLNGGQIAVATNAMSTSAWHHFAQTRSGTTVRLFIDGVQDGSGTSAADLQPATDLWIGGSTDGSYNVTGYLASVRITKGVARYTGNFTPPTLPLPTS